MTRLRRRFGHSATAIVVLCLVCTSCSGKDDRKRVYPVTGQVFYKGRHTPKALVVFHPLNDSDGRAVRAYGYVGEDGRFTLTTYNAHDGAPAGSYRITVEWRLPNPQNEDEEGPNLLPTRFHSVATSGLRAEIREGPCELAPFRLE